MLRIRYFFLFVVLCTFNVQGQEASVEKSIYGIQTGFWGVWGYNETKLSPEWALRSEVGLFDYLGLVEGLSLEPVLTVEPRLYFNLKKRLAKGKRIDGNSGGFFGLKTRFRPDVFSVPVNTYRTQKNPSVAFIPTIGARKNIGSHLNYELGFGLGVEYFQKGWDPYFNGGTQNTDSKLFYAFNIHLRIGFNL